jgi:predicted N-acetyltransferase YhbS
LVLRTATPADVDGILALQVEAFGEEEGPAIRTYLEGPHADITQWSVVADGDRLVSSCALFAWRLWLDEVPVDIGQIEFVATAEAYRRRGVVRAQFDWHHEHSSHLGHVAQFVGGIPYFYRKFGYGYGVSYADLFGFERDKLDPPADVTFRYATEADLPAIMALERFRPDRGLRFDRQERHWRHWIALAEAVVHDGRQLGVERFWVAERAGKVVGWSTHSIEADTGRLLLLPAVTTDATVADAIIAHALDEAGETFTVIGHDTPGTEYGRRLREVGVPWPYGLGIYVRIADPVAFLRTIAPVLSRRLAASSFADQSGSLEISLYETGLAIDNEHGTVTGVRPIAGLVDPFDVDECGVAPDSFPALALGRFGARALEARVDDVNLGKHAELIDVLFPRIDSDVSGDF